MSGLNPFRLRKTEALPVTTQNLDSSVFSTAPAVAPISNEEPKDVSDEAVQPPTPQEVDDSGSLDDDEDSLDPFKPTSISRNNGDGESIYEKSQDRSSSPRDPADGRLQTPAQQPAASFSASPSPPMTANTSVGNESKGYLQQATTRAKRPLPTPPAGARAASSSSTDVSQQLTRPGSTNGHARAVQSVGIDPDTRALASRPANRDKKPPPPPKSHHGKLINPPSQPPSDETTRRYSFQATPEISLSHTSTPSSKPSVQSGDYFSPKVTGNENRAPDLRRSQSQYKRPPTPPISRRQNQMRRSKSSASSKAKQNRLSMPVGMKAPDASPPPSPGTTSLTPSSRRPSRLSLQVDDNVRDTPREDYVPAPVSPAETSSISSSKRPPSIRRSVQGTSPSAAPPPPPPRRARYSNENARPASTIFPEKSTEQDAFPHPSNANNILEDLSRLQKEVDDLRGRYESHKVH